MIKNLINNKVYIGQSKDIYKRWSEHKVTLNRSNGKGCNLHLQSAWNKYGEDNFEFSILEECTIENLNRQEAVWIAYYNSMNSNFGYNKTSGGGANSTVSDEVKERLSEANKGDRNFFYGKKHSKETKLILSEKAKIRFLNKENHPNYGVKFSNERKKEMSLRMKGKYVGFNSYNAKLSEEEIIEIKKELTSGYLYIDEISKKYNVSVCLIYKIKGLVSWVEVGSEYNDILSIVKDEYLKYPLRLLMEVKKELAREEKTYREISKQYNIGTKVLRKIVKNKMIPDVFPELNKQLKNRTNSQKDKSNRVLNETEVDQIKKLILTEQYTLLEIAKMFGVSQSLISQLRLGKIYKDLKTESQNELLSCHKSKKGENNSNSTLTEQDVISIKRRYSIEDISAKQLAVEYNVKETAILSILNNRAWEYLKTEYDDAVRNKLKEKNKNPGDYSKKLTSNDIPYIKKLIYEGLDDKTISKQFGVSSTAIRSIRIGKKWASIKTEYDDLIKNMGKRITAETVIEIKKLINEGYNNKDIMNNINVSRVVLNNIRSGRCWSNI